MGGYTSFFESGYWYPSTYFIKTNKYGDTLWTKTHDLKPGIGRESFDRAVQLDDGSYIAFGDYYDTVVLNVNIYLMKLDSSGDLLWVKTYGDKRWNACVDGYPTSDGGYIILGNTDSAATGENYDIWLIKTDSAGNVQWDYTYGTSNDDLPSSLDLTPDNGYLISGWRWLAQGSGIQDDPFLVKVDSIGNFQWYRNYGSVDNNDYGDDAIQTLDEGYALVGLYKNESNESTAFITKINSAGDIVWRKTNDTNGIYIYKRIQQLSDSSYIIMGESKQNTKLDVEAHLLKLSPQGDILWTRRFGNYNQDDYAHDLQLTSDGGFVFVGEYRHDGPGMIDFWLVKTDSLGCDGNIICPDSVPVITPVEYRDKSKIKIMPNPATDRIYVSFNYNVQAFISLSDITGKTMLYKELQKGTNIISLEDMASGTYIYKITMKNKVLDTGKLVVVMDKW